MSLATTQELISGRVAPLNGQQLSFALKSNFKTLDTNEAVARIAYALDEVIAIYPITPASPMGEWADALVASGRENLWHTVPEIVEMQSEAGAAGVIHGALPTDALSTTFTASQGLLLMIPNDPVSDEVLRATIDEQRVIEHRARALSPDHPVIRGTTQNPDVYFPARETVNPFYVACNNQPKSTL